MGRAIRSTAVAVMPSGSRDEELKELLEARRRAIVGELKDRMRDVRAAGAEKPFEVLDQADAIEADNQGDLECILIQMKAETLNKIAEAMSRLEAGTYGACIECGGEIAEARLRAMPFAVRCTACQGGWESRRERERTQQRRATVAFGTAPRW